MALLRNMLLREEGEDLHLLSALSPDWTRPGDTIKVSNAPTEFGQVGMKCTFTRSGMHMDLEADFQQKPTHVVFHLPWFVTVRTATVDGKPVEVHQQNLSIPPTSREVNVVWTVRSPAPSMSYRSAVKAFLKEYRAHDREFLQDGSPARKPVKMY